MTMLGIVIGIAAVIAVVSLGNGMSSYVKNSLNDLAGNYGMLNINTTKTSERLTREDMLAIEEALPNCKGVSPNLSAYGKVKGRKGTFNAGVTGGSEALRYAMSNDVVKGQYFTRSQVEGGQRVCVMLIDDAKTIFGTEDAIGMELEVTIWGKTATYTIVGLRDHMNDMYQFIMEGQDYFAQIEVPYTALAADFDIDADNSSEKSQNGSLGQELSHDSSGAGTDRLSDPDFPCSLCYRNQHDVHNTDSTYDQRNYRY